MKYIWLSKVNFPNVIAKHKPKWGVAFRWQWRVSWEYNGFGGDHWEAYEELFESRKAAREFKQTQFYRDGNAYTCFRNVKMSRRLVQVNWEEYKDTFDWNAGCGKR